MNACTSFYRFCFHFVKYMCVHQWVWEREEFKLTSIFFASSIVYVLQEEKQNLAVYIFDLLIPIRSVCQAQKLKIKKKKCIVLNMYVPLTSKMADFRVYFTDEIRLHNRKYGREGDLEEWRKPLLQPKDDLIRTFTELRERKKLMKTFKLYKSTEWRELQQSSFVLFYYFFLSFPFLRTFKL